MSINYFVCVDGKGVISSSNQVYYDKSFDLAKKLSAADTAQHCREVDATRIYKLDGKHYILVESSEACLRHMLSSGLVQQSDIMYEDDFTDYLDRHGWDQVPDQDIVDYDGSRLRDLGDPNDAGSCILS